MRNEPLLGFHSRIIRENYGGIMVVVVFYERETPLVKKLAIRRVAFDPACNCARSWLVSTQWTSIQTSQHTRLLRRFATRSTNLFNQK